MTPHSAGTLPMYRLCLAVGLVVALAWTFGCGPPPRPGLPPAANVTGTIKMDGKPLPTGELHFGIPGAPPQVLEIKNGTFSGEAPIGKNQVELFIWFEKPNPNKAG